jgi:hypothetical protein
MPSAAPLHRGRKREPLFNDKTIGGLLLLVGLLNGFPAFLVTVRDCFRYPGVDLRCRVVAARALRMGLDPYLYEWRPGMPEELLDPGRRHPGPSRATYPPTLLMLYVPFSMFPYRTQRVIWFLLEWSAVVASLALLVGALRARAGRTAFLAVGLVFFVAGDLWRFHLERGQFYVFVLLLLALGTRSLVRGGGDGWRGGFWFGLASALRPTFVVMGLPLGLLGYRKTAAAMMASLAMAVAGTLPWFGVQGWASYATTVRNWEHAFAGDGTEEDYFLSAYGPSAPAPQTAEGINFFRALPIETAGSTLIANFHPVYRWLRGLIELPPLLTLARIGFLGFALIVGCLAALLRWRARACSPRFVASFAALTAIDGEYFLPVRYSYADIVFLQPMALLIPALLRSERLWLSRTGVVAGLVLGRYRSLLAGLVEPIEFLLLSLALTAALLQLAASRRVVPDRPDPGEAGRDRGRSGDDERPVGEPPGSSHRHRSRPARG